MTFKCDLCGDTSKPREKAHKVVSSIRDRVYDEGDNLSSGFETVKEVVLCEICNKEVSEEIS